MNKLLTRFLEVITSDRFWYNVLIGVMVGLEQKNWTIGVITALGLITGTGTVDRVADKWSPRKEVS